MTWPDAYATVGATPAHVRLWRVLWLRVWRNRPHLVRLSPVARAIIDGAPERFKRGSVCSVRDMALHICYSQTQTTRGLRQLVQTGHVIAIPYSADGQRVQYCGNPFMLLPHIYPRKVA